MAASSQSHHHPLWPNGAPGAPPAHPGGEADMTTAKDNLIAGKPLIRLGNVSVPTLTVYPPRRPNTGAAIVVFPGGGYNILAIDLEGTEVCDWLDSAGITCVLREVSRPRHRPLSQIRCRPAGCPARYGHRPRARRRVAHRSPTHRRPRLLCRRPLPAAISTHYDKRLYDPIDAADQLSCRPDFASSSIPATSRSPIKTLRPTPILTPPPTPRPPSSSRPKTIRYTSKTPSCTFCSSKKPRSLPSYNLRPGRPRLRPASHQTPSNHVAANSADMAAHDRNPAPQ